MTIMFIFSFRHMWCFFPHILHDHKSLLGVQWLGVAIISVQRVAAGIITPEQLPAFAAMAEAMQKRSNKQ
jgi:hypothetical protein